MKDLNNIIKNSNPFKLDRTVMIILTILAVLSAYLINFTVGIIAFTAACLSLGTIKTFGGKITIITYLIAGAIGYVAKMFIPAFSFGTGLTQIISAAIIFSVVVSAFTLYFVYKVPTKNLVKTIIYLSLIELAMMGLIVVLALSVPNTLFSII